MPEKVFVNENNTATFICPKCNFSKTNNVSIYKDINKEVRMKVNCKCGHSFPIILERRKRYRKDVELPGNYTYSSSGGEIERGTLVVRNISQGGLSFKVKVDPKFSAGEKIFIEFRLDDKQKTFIKKEVLIAK